MKWSIFKYALCAGLMLIWFSPEVSAQQAPAELNSKYDKRVHRYRRNWEKLIPTHTKIQFAGNMGLLSFGTGWDYGKRTNGKQIFSSVSFLNMTPNAPKLP